MATKDSSGDRVRIEDPTQHLTRRRIDEILDRQEQVLYQHMNAKDLLATGEIDEHTARDMVYSAVVNLFHVSRSLFQRVEGGERYWQGGDDWPPLGEIPHPGDGDPMPVVSLQHFFSLNPPLEFPVTEETHDIVRGKQTNTNVYLVHVPMSISLEAADLINDFLRLEAKVDLPLEPEAHRSDEAGL